MVPHIVGEGQNSVGDFWCKPCFGGNRDSPMSAFILYEYLGLKKYWLVCSVCWSCILITKIYKFVWVGKVIAFMMIYMYYGWLSKK